MPIERGCEAVKMAELCFLNKWPKSQRLGTNVSIEHAASSVKRFLI
jgi:hypothetical protein